MSLVALFLRKVIVASLFLGAVSCNAQPTPVFEGHEGAIHSVSFSPDGKCLLGIGGNNAHNIYIWSVETRKVIKTITLSEQPMTVRFTPDGKSLISGGPDNKIHVWDVAQGRLLGSFLNEPANEDVRDIAVFPDGKRLLTASYDCGPVMWDLEKWKPDLLEKVRARINSLAVSADGKRFCFASVESGRTLGLG
jgi:WD40 repeat protein